MARSRRTSSESPKQVAVSRFLLVVTVFGLWILGIGIRLVYLQVSKHEELFAKAQGQRRDPMRSKMLRGTIFDRNDRTLAISIRTKSLAADPTMVDDVNLAAKKLAGPLGLKQAQLAKDLKTAKDGGKRFLWIARKLEDESVAKVNDALKGLSPGAGEPGLAGLFWRDEQKRSYPYQSLAAHILGFSNSDDIGQAGIEQSQEENLRGSVVKGWQERDRLGRVLETDSEEQVSPKNVVLTISNSIQYKTEEALAAGAKAAYARSAMAVVMDPKTGEILAMANYPTFDPNTYAAAKPEVWMNHAVQSIYAPGSVFKLVTYSSAIQENLIEINQMIDCSAGKIDVAGHVFKDSHSIGNVSYIEALAHSSNVAAIRTGLRVGKERFYSYAKGFGFGERTGVELPGEVRGQFRSPERWAGDSLGSMSIGYEMGVTALQMASAFATIANDGVRAQPHIIKEIRNEDGSVASTPEVPRTQVVSPETAANVRKMLRQVVVNGTGRRAQLNGYTSAGKTGTAWKFNPKLKKVDPGKYVSSFIGFAPAENPAVLIAVVMDEPAVGARDGGTVSAPVFKAIAEQILPELNIVPDANIKQAPPPPVEIPEAVTDDQGKGVADDDTTATDAKKDKAEDKKKTAPTPKPPAATPKTVVDERKNSKDKKKK